MRNKMTRMMQLRGREQRLEMNMEFWIRRVNFLFASFAVLHSSGKLASKAVQKHEKCYICSLCKVSFARKQKLNDHIASVHEHKKNPSDCRFEFFVHQALKQHKSTKYCNDCMISFECSTRKSTALSHGRQGININDKKEWFDAERFLTVKTFKKINEIL